MTGRTGFDMDIQYIQNQLVRTINRLAGPGDYLSSTAMKYAQSSNSSKSASDKTQFFVYPAFLTC
jgi:hypothetical protein